MGLPHVASPFSFLPPDNPIHAGRRCRTDHGSPFHCRFCVPRPPALISTSLPDRRARHAPTAHSGAAVRPSTNPSRSRRSTPKVPAWDPIEVFELTRDMKAWMRRLGQLTAKAGAVSAVVSSLLAMASPSLRADDVEAVDR